MRRANSPAIRLSSCQTQKTGRAVVGRHRQRECAGSDRLRAEGVNGNRLVALRAVVEQHSIKRGRKRDRRVDNRSARRPVGSRAGVRRLRAVRDSNATGGVVCARDFAGRVVNRVARTTGGTSKEQRGLDRVFRGGATGNRSTEGMNAQHELDFETGANCLAIGHLTFLARKRKGPRRAPFGSANSR
jgi:hypothetical protein